MMSDEWWWCLIDYPSFWPWAGRHRPCYGLAILLSIRTDSCYSPKRHSGFMHKRTVSWAHAGVHAIQEIHEIYLWYKWCPASISYLPNCQITMVPAGVILHCMRRGQLCGMAGWLLDVRIHLPAYTYTCFVASNFEFLHEHIPTSTLSLDIV